jgi:signal peptidase II
MMRWIARQFVGPFTRYGVVTALVTAALDQATKLWLVFQYDLPAKGRVYLTPFLDLVMTWNTGISYGLFKQQDAFGRWVLLVVGAGLVVLLWNWLARAHSRLVAVSLGLIIGGAIGNIADRFAYGAVVDFILFHVTRPHWTFNWYVFNLADAAIVAGVVGLLYGFARVDSAAKAP